MQTHTQHTLRPTWVHHIIHLPSMLAESKVLTAGFTHDSEAYSYKRLV